MSDRPDAAWRRVLFNPREGRLRAGWRLLAVVPAQVVAVFVGGLVFAILLGVAPSAGPVATVLLALGWFAIYGSMAVAAFAMARWFDRRPWDAWVSGPAWWRDVAAGLVGGLGMATAAVAVGLASGDYHVAGTLVTRPEAPLLPMPDFAVVIGPTHPLLVVSMLFVVHVGVGLSEEVLVRGYLLTNLAEGVAGFDRVGPRGAIAFAALATSILFGVFHAGNPNVGAVAVLNIVLAGLFFAGAYVATGSLGLAIGLHVAWNFALAGVYGLPVSGLDAGGSLLAIENVGDTAVTGGPFGPEAGLVFYPALVAGIAITAAWIRHSRGTIAAQERIAIYAPPEESTTDQGATETAR